jgi:UDP-glucose 4-epimerase
VLCVDIAASLYTHVVGYVAKPSVVHHCLTGVQAVLHTATLHKPHVATHSKQDFADANITGTLNLLEEAVLAKAGAFVFTSTTSVFGRALSPTANEPAACITEDIVPLPKNIYGVTKLSAENLCEVFAYKHEPCCTVLRTSRFFPEVDDNRITRTAFEDSNIKANEPLYRRADIEDIVNAHVLVMDKSLTDSEKGHFARYIISATTPFVQGDLAQLRTHAPTVSARYFTNYPDLYADRGWSMFSGINRVFVNARARIELGWQPHYDFEHVLACLREGMDYRCRMALATGSKGTIWRCLSMGRFRWNSMFAAIFNSGFLTILGRRTCSTSYVIDSIYQSNNPTETRAAQTKQRIM